MSTRTKVFGSLFLLGVAGLGMSWFGNYEPKTDPRPATSVVITPSASAPTTRRVTLRAEHQNAHADMHVDWSFGKGTVPGDQWIDKSAAAFEVVDTALIGNVVSITSRLGSGWEITETMKVQILFDGVPQCPDYWFSRGQKTFCIRTVV